ncbi:MAG: hypothetical protein ACJ8KC_09285, partial [Candidatus Udaeobacter sp.]
MTLDDIIRNAADQPFDATEVSALCKELSMSLEEFTDAVSRIIATRYSGRQLDFGFCDAVMNHLYAFTTKRGEEPMPPYALSVFIAFDEGEYSHPDDPAGSLPETLYTRPMIADVLAHDAQV